MQQHFGEGGRMQPCMTWRQLKLMRSQKSVWEQEDRKINGRAIL